MPSVRIAAAGDLHASERVRPRIEEAFRHIADQADVVLLTTDEFLSGPLDADLAAGARILTDRRGMVLARLRSG